MSSIHPSKALLKQFIEAELDDAMAMIVSAHISSCDDCHKHVTELQDTYAEAAMRDGVEQEMSLELDISIDDIMCLAEEQTDVESANSKQIETPTVQFQGREFKLPEQLAGFSDRSGPWTRVMNKVWRSEITGHGLPYQLDFIYMEPGGSVPSHNHKGNEYTLVIDGDFSDGVEDYKAGDLVQFSGVEEHEPFSRNGCLCIAAIDAPLHFTSGMARLINPFSQLFFSTEGQR
jgi:putative transcriptional regulator